MNRNVLGALLFTLIGLIVFLFKPFDGLEGYGHQILGVVIIALGLWIFKPGNVPLFAGCAVVIFGALAVLNINSRAGNFLDLLEDGTTAVHTYTSAEVFNVATNGFTSSTVWTLLPALYFGFVLQKTGLGKRLAYMVLKSFNPSWVTMALSWFIIGVILSAFTPSITVRIAIVVPIAMGIVEACKLEPRSKGSAFVTALAWAMCIFPGTGWLTGSLSGPFMQGVLPIDMKVFATNAEWIRILCLPWMIITILFMVLAYIFAKPNQPIGIPVETFREEYKSLGPISKNETIVLVTLIICLIMFFTESKHGIPTAATALMAMFVFLISGIISPPELNTGINWDVILFFGATVGLSSLFRFAHITNWFGPIVEPTIKSLAPTPLLFMIVFTIGMLIIRFIDVPWGFTTIALVASVTSVLATDFGYHPLVVTMAFLIGINFFLLNYQQPWMLMAEGLTQNRGWAPNHMMLFGGIYVVSALVALVIAVPYWSSIGVLSIVIP